MLAAKDIPDLQFDAAEPDEKGESSVKTEVMEIIDVERKRNMMVSQNNDFREHSKNLLESAAGEAQEQVSEQISVQKMMDLEQHDKTCECREHSQKSRSSDKETSTKTASNI